MANAVADFLLISLVIAGLTVALCEDVRSSPADAQAGGSISGSQSESGVGDFRAAFAIAALPAFSVRPLSVFTGNCNASVPRGATVWKLSPAVVDVFFPRLVSTALFSAPSSFPSFLSFSLFTLYFSLSLFLSFGLSLNYSLDYSLHSE